MGDTDDRIGPYRVLRRLGVGGMAEAFEALRAHDRGVAHRVCVKRVLPAYAEDPELVRLFEHEARMMAALAHANIVGVIDVGAHEGRPYLVLELVDGIDLRALLHTAPGKRLDADVVRFIAYELATALAFAHAPDPPRRDFGVVHRDLSPSNVLIARGGEVRLTDFGLAKAVAAQPVTQSGAVRGKIPYMAPEHMRGAPIDGRADLFSLGVILFECLAGARPFDGSHEVETMTRVLAGTRLDLSALRPDLDPALVALVSRLLETDRDARFVDARAVVEAIHAIGPVRRARPILGRLVESRLGGITTRAHVREARADGVDDRDAPSSLVIEMGTSATAPARRIAAERDKSDVTMHDDALHAMLERTAASLDDARPRADAEATALVPREPDARPRLRTVAALAIGAVVAGVAAAGALTVAEDATTATPSRAGTPLQQRDVPAVTSTLRAPPEPTPAPAPVVAITPPVAAPTPDDDAPPAVSHDVASSSSGATARIVIEPWGKVWVDGRLLGRAPRSVTLSPGTHVIEGGFENPTHRRSVTLGAGERRRVELDITPRD